MTLFEASKRGALRVVLLLSRRTYRIRRACVRYQEWEDRVAERLRELEALPIGTRVRLFGPARRGYPDWEQAAVWEIEFYRSDVDDYRLITREGPEEGKVRGRYTTYARREAMEVVK